MINYDIYKKKPDTTFDKAMKIISAIGIGYLLYQVIMYALPFLLPINWGILFLVIGMNALFRK